MLLCKRLSQLLFHRIDDAVNISSDDIKSRGFDQSEFRDTVKVPGQRFDVSGSVFFREEIPAGSCDICQAFCPAQADGNPFLLPL